MEYQEPSMEYQEALMDYQATSGVVPFVMVNRIRQGRSLSRRGVPGHVRVYLDTFGYTSMPSHEIYDIGTEILFLQ